MAFIMNLPAAGAISYVLAYAICLHGILPEAIKRRFVRLGIFGGLILPYILFLFRPTLSSHLLLAVGIILVAALVFNLKLFISCGLAVFSYLIVTYGMLCAHILQFALSDSVNITGVLTVPDSIELAVIHLAVTFGLVHVYRGFVRFYKESRQKTKADMRILSLVNGAGLLLQLIGSNLYLRFLASYSKELIRIPKLMAVLVCAFAAMSLIMVLLMYLLNLNIVSRLHLHRVKVHAERDLQTGVLNRQTGLDLLGERIRECKLSGKPLTICFVDINNLKQVNDKLGHKAGDRLIEVVSTTIRTALRNRDYVCRLGGDEFLVTFCDCGIAQARSAWNRIYTLLMKKNECPEIGFPVSVSYGFAEYNAIEGLSVMDFIEQADAAMYAHKSKYKHMKKSGGEPAAQELQPAPNKE